LGDLQALAGRDYRVVRIHLGRNVATGLKAVQVAVRAALGAKKKPAAREPVKSTIKRPVKKVIKKTAKVVRRSRRR